MKNAKMKTTANIVLAKKQYGRKIRLRGHTIILQLTSTQLQNDE
jgi:hypothetical protein